jgi:transcriptional regulator with PAS, ATPase and Fis domain
MAVLLTGETGTGKEVLTRLIHDWSARREMPFVPVNCAAIPHEMLEAELFGYARGAFSGAVKRYDGRLRAAEGGSVFLDEVDDTPPSFQLKLLRVLEDRVVSRLGESTWRKVDFRILAATNRDLEGLIAQGLFAADLFERLAIVSIRVPPLRERREDIPELCEQLIARFYLDEPDALSRHAVERVTPEAMSLLLTHDWPGNIRELRNVLYAGLVRKRTGSELLVSDLPPQLFRRHGFSEPPAGEAVIDHARLRAHIETGRFNLREAVAGLEREALRLALERTRGNAASAAILLGEVGRGTAKSPGATVRAMMRRLGVGPG